MKPIAFTLASMVAMCLFQRVQAQESAPVRIDPTFSDANWISMNPSTATGLNDLVRALAVSGSDLYVGGYFTNAVRVAANRVAKWNGRSWSAVGSGMNNVVSTLAVSGSNLYAGGWFTTADGNEANYIAQWNGRSWSPLGSGMNNQVSAMTVSGNNLYAGGRFTNAGGIAASYIAKWNGNDWSPLGSGTIGWVFSLAAAGNDLYAGGLFRTAGGIAANYIAKWNGSSWSALGSGMNEPVLALAVSGSDLYAGGFFTAAGGRAASRIAKWNGTTWSALGSGFSGGVDLRVCALAISGRDLYAGGVFDFTTTEGNPDIYFVNNLAKWDGRSWSALGSGMGGAVHALAVSGNELYAGGGFATAGGKLSPYLARARVGSIATSLVTTNSFVSIEFFGVTGYQYDVQRATDLNPPILWTNVTTSPFSPADDGSFSFTDTSAPPGTAYYRAVER